MKIEIFKLLILLLFVSPSISQSPNPSDYIWVNYQKSNPVTQFDDNFYSVIFPCQTRLRGGCTHTFTLLPPGWRGFRNGTILIPADSINKAGAQTIRVDLVELTGQRLKASVVAQISGGFMKVTEQSQFFKQNNYTPRTNTEPSTQYSTSPLVDSRPEGFPNMTEIESKYSSGNKVQIDLQTSEILYKYAPCRSKINYLKDVKQVIEKILKRNLDMVANNRNRISVLEKNLADLRRQKQNTLKQNGVTEAINKLNAQIISVQFEVSSFKLQKIHAERRAKKALQQFTKYNPFTILEDIQNKKKALFEFAQSEADLNSEIIANLQKKLIVKKLISDLQLVRQSKGIQQELPLNGIKSSYKKSAKTGLKYQAKQMQYQIKTRDIRSDLEEANLMVKNLQQKVKSLQQIEKKEVEEINSEKVQQIKQENDLLSKELKQLQKFLAIVCRTQ